MQMHIPRQVICPIFFQIFVIFIPSFELHAGMQPSKLINEKAYSQLTSKKKLDKQKKKLEGSCERERDNEHGNKKTGKIIK